MLLSEKALSDDEAAMVLMVCFCNNDEEVAGAKAYVVLARMAIAASVYLDRIIFSKIFGSISTITES